MFFVDQAIWSTNLVLRATSSNLVHLYPSLSLNPHFHFLLHLQKNTHTPPQNATSEIVVHSRSNLNLMDPAAQRRLKAIHSHLIPATDSSSHLRLNPTAGEFVSGILSLSLSIQSDFRWMNVICPFEFGSNKKDYGFNLIH